MKKNLIVIILVLIIFIVLWVFLYYNRGVFTPVPIPKDETSSTWSELNGFAWSGEILNASELTPEEVFLDRDLNYVMLYNVFSEQDVNTFELFYDHYIDDVATGSLDTFTDFFEDEWWAIMMYIAFAKLQDQRSWDSFSNYLLDYNTANGSNIIFSITWSPDVNYETRQQYLEYMRNYYNSDESIVYTGDDNDFNIIFGSSDIDSSVSDCKNIFNTAEEIDSCIDHVYFAKSTQENPYCDKMKDTFKQNLCVNFYKYIANN